VTRDRDVGEKEPYTDIKPDQWQKVGNAMVYYLTAKSNTIKNIQNIISSTPHHILFLNSFFDPLTVKVLLLRRLVRGGLKPVIVAPRGEFAWGSLKLKYPKKFVYIQMAKLLGLYSKVVWHASSKFEAGDIMKIMRINTYEIHIALDLPTKTILKGSPATICQPVNDPRILKIVFLSRIAREKNLDYALKVLCNIKLKAIFDIYGPTDDATYWKECQKLMANLPGNVSVNYLGSVNPAEVVNIFSSYDLFFLPTAGENYGHVIAESLTAGTPVLISTETPWRDLQSDGFGWDIDLSRVDLFVEIIEKLALSGAQERFKTRTIIKKKIMERLLNPAALEANRQLFKEQLLC
jgi:glycosyltransferase involved in cell wall biosynthesis